MRSVTPDNVTPLRRGHDSPEQTFPPTFVATGGPGTGLPEGQYLLRVLNGAVVLSHRENPWATWSRPVEAVRG